MDRPPGRDQRRGRAGGPPAPHRREAPARSDAGGRSGHRLLRPGRRAARGIQGDPGGARDRGGRSRLRADRGAESGTSARQMRLPRWRSCRRPRPTWFWPARAGSARHWRPRPGRQEWRTGSTSWGASRTSGPWSSAPPRCCSSAPGKASRGRSWRRCRWRSPVIASTARGNCELIGDDRGLVFQTGDIAGLANAMRWMIEQPDERRRMGLRGRSRMVERYDLRVVVRMHEDLYASCSWSATLDRSPKTHGRTWRVRPRNGPGVGAEGLAAVRSQLRSVLSSPIGGRRWTSGPLVRRGTDS